MTGSEGEEHTSGRGMPDDKWQPSHHGGSGGAMQGRVARGLTWTLIDTWGSQLLGLVIFVLLARLLLPVDFGLVNYAAIFVAFAAVFVDQGLGDAVVQRPTLTTRQLDTAFWASLLTGLAITVAGFVLAIPIAAVLGEPQLEPIIQVLSITFLLTALSSIQTGLLRRELAFRSLALRRLVAVAVSGAIGVGMAFAGFGAWALVGQQVASAAVSVLMLWAVTPWRPGLHFDRQDFREMFGFGINVVGGDMLNFISRNTDNLLIGVVLGKLALGFYGVGYRILDTSQTLLINAARKLVFPTFSRLQHDPERIRRAYSRMNRASSALTLPGYVGLALVAQEATVVFFGQRWAASGPVAAVLFLIGPALTISAFSGALFNAVGHPEVTLRFRLATTITNVIGFLVAVLIFRDILAVAVAFVLRGYLLLPLNLYWLRVYGGIPIREHLLELKGAVAATVAMALAVVIVKVTLLGHASNAVLLLAEVFVATIVFAVALLAFERALVAELVTVAGQALPGGMRIARLLRLPVAPTAGRKGRAVPEPGIPASLDTEPDIDPAGITDEHEDQLP
ncbi:MAG TPA: lipopolysaccharide biosynthesis protein [Candidatus Limnocylindria bacterium]|nr:lipopolysaccharide biosynthesis protein [Candidatus Limnocylindria bacterium]